MRYILAATFAAAIATGFALPAHAQISTGKEKTPLELMYERQDKERQENERAYNQQMKRLKAQGPAATSSDPWKGVRSATDSSAKK